MSLIKSPAMTDSKRAANQRNAKLSQGAVTEESRARIAAAQTRHGLYAKSMEFALDSWGEDPAEFAELLEGLWQEFDPAGALQPRLVTRLAQVLWTIERAERRQEGEALRRAQTAARGRENRLHARMMRLQMTAQALRRLARSLAEPHYVTPREDLEIIKKLHQDGAMGELGEIAVDLFYQLQAPGTDADGVSEDDKRRRVVNSIRSIFGLSAIDSPVQMRTPKGETLIVRPEGWVDPEEDDDDEEGNGGDGEGEDDDEEDSARDSRYPTISAEDWRVRERARKLLKNLLTRQVDSCETERKALLRESLAGPSLFELAVENAPSHAEVLLMRRVQDANMREVRKLTNLLLKLKREERQRPPLEADEPAEGRAGLEPGPLDLEPSPPDPPDAGPFDSPERSPSHPHDEGPCLAQDDGPCHPQTEGRGGSRCSVS